MNREDTGSSIVPKKWIKWLSDEADFWKQEGIISEEQGTQILNRYSSSDNVSRAEDRKNARFITIISVLGSILLGLGIILLFAHNWKLMDVPARLGIIFGLIASTYFIGYWFAYEKKIYITVGKALILLGVLFFGAGIWLVAQIFNINANFPDAVFYWAAGGILVALATRLKSVISLTIVLLTLWTIMEQGGFQNQNYLFILIMMIIIFPLTYIEKSRLAAILGVLAVTIWFGIFNLIWQLGAASSPKFAYMNCGLLIFFIFLYGFSRLQIRVLKRADFELPFRTIAMFGIFTTLYAMTFRGMEESARTNLLANFSTCGFIIVYSILFICIFAVLFINMYNDRTKIKIFEGTILLSLIALTLLYILLPFEGNGAFYLYTIVSNIVFFGLAIAVLALGFKERRPVFINMALLFFVIDVITRYFDYLWRLLPRSVFFIAGGLVLIAGSIFLENRRRKIMNELR